MGAQLETGFTRVNVMVSGTPVATELGSPRVVLMSLRTMPESASAFGPFEPSPGYGPAVSSGMLEQLPLPVPASVPPSVPEDALDPPSDPEPGSPASDPQPMSG